MPGTLVPACSRRVQGGGLCRPEMAACLLGEMDVQVDLARNRVIAPCAGDMQGFAGIDLAGGRRRCSGGFAFELCGSAADVGRCEAETRRHLRGDKTDPQRAGAGFPDVVELRDTGVPGIRGAMRGGLQPPGCCGRSCVWAWPRSFLPAAGAPRDAQAARSMSADRAPTGTYAVIGRGCLNLAGRLCSVLRAAQEC